MLLLLLRLRVTCSSCAGFMASWTDTADNSSGIKLQETNQGQNGKNLNVNNTRRGKKKEVFPQYGYI